MKVKDLITYLLKANQDSRVELYTYESEALGTDDIEEISINQNGNLVICSVQSEDEHKFTILFRED